MNSELGRNVGKAVHEYTWLMVDAFLLLFLMASTLAYNDFDDEMKRLFRVLVIAFWGYIWISGLHLLVYLRCYDRGKPMPGVVSYSLFALKLALIVGVACWARRNLLV